MLKTSLSLILSKFFFIALLITPLSCQDDFSDATVIQDTIEQEATDEQKIAYFRDMYEKAFEYADDHIEDHFHRKDSVVTVIDITGMTKQVADSVIWDYIPEVKMGKEQIKLLTQEAREHVISNSVSINSKATSSINIDRLSYLSTNQKRLVKPFYNSVYSAVSYSQVKSITDSFNEQIINSSLTSSEKPELYSMSAGIWGVADFFFNKSGARSIYNAMARDLTPNSRTSREMGCNVNTRSVWAGAVVGFFAGATQGGYIGATAGTFTAPVIGTVTGGVSGAVAGGAVGFVTGALSAVTAELLTTCFRSCCQNCDVPQGRVVGAGPAGSTEWRACDFPIN